MNSVLINAASVQEKPLAVAVIGPVPPPPGGAGASIVSVLAALSEEPGVQAFRLEWYEIWKCLFRRTDVIHFNLQHPFKRFVASLLGRMMGLTVLHTVHGNTFDFDRWSNKAAIAFSHGFILLNRDIHLSFQRQAQTRFTLMTPLLRTTALAEDGELDVPTQRRLDRAGAVKFAVVYAHTKDFRQGQETYGFLFVADNLPQLQEMGIWVIFLDPKAAYDPNELDPHNAGNFIHIPTGVNFRALLRRTFVYLRPTSTDGNSVAVLEALENGVPVVASDAVARPEGATCYTYGDKEDFLDAIRRATTTGKPAAHPQLSTSADYLVFLRQLRTKKRGDVSCNAERSNPG